MTIRDAAHDEVEAWIRSRIAPGQAPIVQLLRSLMEEHAPEAREVLTYGILGWRVRRVIAVLNPTAKEITFAFSRGAAMDDPDGLLRGVGTVSKHVKLRSVDAVDRAALGGLIRQAVALDGT